ncbi:hypothetical protein DFQ28_006983 [Apophysomyces sp. BC1034]|nr:hypothetical protein DFQ29_005281 [Apophysomyces sp. BC1021]KAG0192951.1 hypothetical protein DFQ28_006983 [Apophysomyces sp. BC1034]
MSSQSVHVALSSTNPSSWDINDSALDLLNAAIASHHQLQFDQESEQETITNDQHLPAGLEVKKETKKSQQSQTSSTKRRIGKTDQAPQQVPTTPKRPGRKPLERAPSNELLLDPKQKRKAQNRAAQRAFRERKEKHVSELQERIRELEDACALKDEDLIKENLKLKQELKKLQEENYALKGTMFTFQFPVPTDGESTTTPVKGETVASLSSNSFSSGNSCSGEEGLSSTSSDHSPQSHTTLDVDNLNSTPSSKDTVYTFGAIPREQDFDFLAVPGNDTPTNPALGELFHGKDELFMGYRVPANDDFLFDGEQLTSLFGTNDLLGITVPAPFSADQEPLAPMPSESFSEQAYASPYQPNAYDIRKNIQNARNQGQNAYEVRAQLEECPGFNLDMLCEDLKRKATCTKASYVLSDRDVDAFVNCFNSSK